MKKYVVISMLLILVSFSVFTNPSIELKSYPFDSTDGSVISEVDTIVDSNVITETIQFIVQKWQTELLFPPTQSSQDLKGSFVSFMFINHVFLPGEIARFICVVHHQSSYLP